MKNNRLLILGVIAMVIVVAFASCGANGDYEQESEVVIEEKMNYGGVEEYEVQPFDTLSKIATKYIPSDKYMAEWIDDVKKLNGRKTSDIYSGETIYVWKCEWKNAIDVWRTPMAKRIIMLKKFY